MPATTTDTAAEPKPALRRTTSEQIDQTKPAYRVVRKCGGLAAFCRDFDFKPSTVHSWMVRGIIPSRQRDFPGVGRVSVQAWIIHRAKQLELDLEPADFIEREIVAQ